MPVSLRGSAETNRAIQIGDFPPMPCGGTHVSDTREIGRVVIKGVKVKQGRMRISYELEGAP